MDLQNLDDSGLAWMQHPHSPLSRPATPTCGSIRNPSFWSLCLTFGIISTLLTACGAFSASPMVEDSTPPEPGAIAPTEVEPRTLPETKISPLTLEGEADPIELKLFNQDTLPFITYVPSQEFVTEPVNSEVGRGVTFYFMPNQAGNTNSVEERRAYVQLVIPTAVTSLDRLRSSILSPQGILSSQGWEISDRTEVVSYGWAREKIVYRATGENTAMGAIFIAEYGNRAFYALTHYPAEYSDGFEPRAALILENFELKNK